MTEMTRREFTLTRVLDAPRELVFRAWTDPDQLAAWWGPEGISTPRSGIEVDPRPGGAFRLVMVLDADGTEFPSDMEFREVVEPERLVYGWEAQRGLGAGTVTVTFADLGGRTEMVTHFVGDSTDEMAAMAQAGWTTQIAKLERLLAQRSEV
jgi:uncharacterized protein YndB with AHSA1/START domain